MQNAFWYLEPFRRCSQVWRTNGRQTDRQTYNTGVSNSAVVNKVTYVHSANWQIHNTSNNSPADCSITTLYTSQCTAVTAPYHFSTFTIIGTSAQQAHNALCIALPVTVTHISLCTILNEETAISEALLPEAACAASRSPLS